MELITVAVVKPESANAILGVADGVKPNGVEGDADVADRVAFLRRIGYKLG